VRTAARIAAVALVLAVVVGGYRYRPRPAEPEGTQLRFTITTRGEKK
jgi:hypothetical protein